MGKIADLLEKKALGTITDVETQELNTLLKEAALVEEKSTEGDDEEQVEALAQKLADSATSKIDASLDKFAKVMESFSAKNAEATKSVNTEEGFIIDKQLGRKHTVE